MLYNIHDTCGVQLLDMCRRLDALEESGLTDPVEKKEVVILRLLMSVSLIF